MNSIGEPARTRPDGNGTTSLSDRVRSLRLAEGGGRTAAPGRALPWVFCGVLLLTTVAFGYRAYRLAPAPAPPSGETARPEATPGTAAAPVAATGDVVLQAKGYVIPAHQVQLSPKVGGMIVWLDPAFKEGKYYKKDEPMARLEDIDYLADVNHARAALAAAQQRYQELQRSWPKEIEQAQRELDESKANLQQMQREMVRNERMVGTNAVAQRDWEQAKFGYEAMARRVERLEAALWLVREGPRKEKLDAASADVKAAEADLKKAEWRLENCVITAPIDGHVLTKRAEKGNICNPLAFNISSILCDMADLAQLEIDLSIQERDIKAITDEQYCTVMPEAYQNFEPFRQKHPDGYKGKVSRQMPIADRSKGAIQVRVEVVIPPDEVGKYLKPDMSVLVSFYKPGFKDRDAASESDRGKK
jgi:multidrug resistance efflux pump